MLSDRERKLLRILYNFSHMKNRMPFMRELVTFTGAKEVVVWKSVDVLAEKGHLHWEPGKLHTIQIIEPNERDAILSQPMSIDAMKYWPD